MHAADTIGIRALLVHALSEDAKTFYCVSGSTRRRSIP